jgi:hypothetical protein
MTSNGDQERETVVLSQLRQNTLAQNSKPREKLPESEKQDGTIASKKDGTSALSEHHTLMLTVRLILL